MSTEDAQLATVWIGAFQLLFALGQIAIVWFLFERGRNVWIEQFDKTAHYKAAEEILYSTYSVFDFLQNLRAATPHGWLEGSQSSSPPSETERVIAEYVRKGAALQANRPLLSQMMLDSLKAETVLGEDISNEVETINEVWSRSLEAYRHMHEMAGAVGGVRAAPGDEQKEADAVFSNAPGRLDHDLEQAFNSIRTKMLPNMQLKKPRRSSSST
jgi:hypothetical protein